MASVNKVFIMGRLGQDPELRYTQGQVAVATLNVATTESWGQEGQKQEKTEWHRVVVWNRAAENCAKYLAKGRAVFIEGRLQTRQWDDKNGQKRYTTEINASNVQFLPSAGAGAPNQMPGNADMDSRSSGFDGSFSGSSFGGDTPSMPLYATGSGDGLDDIPF